MNEQAPDAHHTSGAQGETLEGTSRRDEAYGIEPGQVVPLTQDLRGRLTPPNMAKQVWPFCPTCGHHRKSAVFRTKTRTVKCASCFSGHPTDNESE